MTISFNGPQHRKVNNFGFVPTYYLPMTKVNFLSLYQFALDSGTVKILDCGFNTEGDEVVLSFEMKGQRHLNPK